MSLIAGDRAAVHREIAAIIDIDTASSGISPIADDTATVHREIATN